MTDAAGHRFGYQLTFFRSELLKGISFFAAYDRYNASPRLRDGKYYTQDAKGGVTWKYRKFSASVNATWTDSGIIHQ